MPDILTDNDFTIATAISDLRFTAPFSAQGIPDFYIVEQDFVIERESFVPLAKDTAHPTLAGYYLVDESPMQPLAIANLMRWTRKYAKLPASFSRPGGNYNYVFPAILSTTLAVSRAQTKTMSVKSRVQTDFFHQADPFTIPTIPQQRYVIAGQPNLDAVGPYGSPVVSDASFTTVSTDPSAATYLTWIAGKIEIVPEESKLTPNWMGGYFHMRETIYIEAH